MLQKLLNLALLALITALSCSQPTDGDGQDYDCLPPFDAWASWSPDGRYITYTWRALDTLSIFRYGPRSVWMYDTQSGSCGFLVGPGLFPKWNPQGNILAFNWGQAIYFYYPDSRYVKRVTNVGEVYEFNWSYNGAEIIFNGLYTGGYGAIIIDTLGNKVRNVLPANYPVAGVGVWSRYGDQILLPVWDSLTHGSVILVDTLGNFIREVLPYQGLGLGDEPSWSQDESRFAADVLYPDDNGVITSEVRIYDIEGHLISYLSDGGYAKWSPADSQLAFQRVTVMIPPPDRYNPGCSRVTIWTCNADGSDMHELLGWPQPEYDSAMFDGGYNWLNPPPP